MNAETIASLTTAAGTLVLAVATFGSTRSANRASQFAERALQAGLRPVLVHGQFADPRQKIGFADEHWVHVEGAGAAFEEHAGNVYLALAVRNVGSGIAVIQGWHPTPERLLGQDSHPPTEQFRSQTRDLFIAAGEVGFWQGAFRDPADPLYTAFAKAARERSPVTIDVLYTDVHAGQRTISRFSVMPGRDGAWMGAVSRHWMLDGPSPR